MKKRIQIFYFFNPFGANSGSFLVTERIRQSEGAIEAILVFLCTPIEHGESIFRTVFAREDGVIIVCSNSTLEGRTSIDK